MSEWLAMGGYAVFVWSAYGVSALGLAGLLAVSLRQAAAAKRRLAALEPEGAAQGGVAQDIAPGGAP